MFKRLWLCADAPEADSSEFESLEGVTSETLENFRGNKGEEGT